MKPEAAVDRLISERIDEHLSVITSLRQDPRYLAVLAAVARDLTRALARGGKILIFGNGGSAADAQHLVAEMTGRFRKERRALPSIALTTNTSSLTAIGNDYSYDFVFARQLEALGAAGDVAVGLSTSGNSPNVIAALEVARRKKLLTVGLTGSDRGKLQAIVDHCIQIPSSNTARIQEGHILAGHILCELVENEFCDNQVVFLDRDGVLNKKAPEDDYIRSWDQVELLPDVVSSVARLNAAGFKVFIVTNQRGVARGMVHLPELEEIHRRMRARFAEEGAQISGVYYCPHDYSDQCDCRKPKPGMLLRAAHENGFHCGGCWMIGDSDSDIEAGRRAGCRTIRIGSSDAVKQQNTGEFVAPDLPSAVEFIVARTQLISH